MTWSEKHQHHHTPILHSPSHPSFRDSLSSKEPTEHRDESRKKREGQRLLLHEKRKKEKKRRIGKLGHKRPVGPADANLCFIRFLFSFSLYLSCAPSSVVFVNRDFPEPSKGITRQAVSQASFWVPRTSLSRGFGEGVKQIRDQAGGSEPKTCRHHFWLTSSVLWSRTTVGTWQRGWGGRV